MLINNEEFFLKLPELFKLTAKSGSVTITAKKRSVFRLSYFVVKSTSLSKARVPNSNANSTILLVRAKARDSKLSTYVFPKNIITFQMKLSEALRANMNLAKGSKKGNPSCTSSTSTSTSM